MLTLTTPIQVSYTSIEARELRVDRDPSVEVELVTRDAAGNTERHTLHYRTGERQGLRVTTGRIAVYTEAAPAGYAAAVFNAFAGAGGGAAAKFRALETKLRDDGLLPAGTVA